MSIFVFLAANYALCSYDVQKILQVRQNGMTQQFLVKWEGYSKAYNSWEPGILTYKYFVSEIFLQHLIWRDSTTKFWIFS